MREDVTLIPDSLRNRNNDIAGCSPQTNRINVALILSIYGETGSLTHCQRFV